MKVVLELAEEDSNIRRVTIRHDIVIGRGSDCNLRISTPEVSRRHCFLRIDHTSVAITDLESCNGTWLDGQKTVPGKRYFLKDGMRLAVGPVRFVTRIYDDETAGKLSDDTVARMSQHHNSALSPNFISVDSMDFAMDSTGDDAKIDSSDIDITGGESEPAVLPDDATEVIGANDSAEGPVEVIVFSEAVDEEVLDDPEIAIKDEVSDDDGTSDLQEFLRRNR